MAIVIRHVRSFLLALALLSALAPALGWAQALEASVKAALVYRFAGYVDWPPGTFATPDAPLVIGVTGADDVAAELELLARGRSIANRPLVVRTLKEGDPLAGVQVLYVGRREAGRIAALAKAARPLSILLITDSDRGLENGSVINFVPVEDRVGFEVSLEAADRSNLRLSSRMLAVARRVLAKAS